MTSRDDPGGPVPWEAPPDDDTQPVALPPIAPPGMPAAEAPQPAPMGGPPPPPAIPPPTPPPILPWAPPAQAGGAAVPAGIEFAGVPRRFVAYWVDGIIVEIIGLAIAIGVGVVLGVGGSSLTLAGLLAGIAFLGVHLLYFVGFWTGPARATLGMRLLHLQIGLAASGATLSVQQGIVRWLALGGVLQALSIVPGLTNLVVVLAPLWALVLLISTLASPTRQGLHDRVAGSAIVQPAGSSASGAVLACLVIAVVVFGIALVSIVALIFLGGQVSSILSSVGDSV